MICSPTYLTFILSYDTTTLLSSSYREKREEKQPASRSRLRNHWTSILQVNFSLALALASALFFKRLGALEE